MQVGPGGIHGHHLQEGHLAPQGQGSAQAGHEAPLVFPIGEDLQDLAGFQALGDLGQQDRPLETPVQEGPIRSQAKDLQVVQGAEGGRHGIHLKRVIGVGWTRAPGGWSPGPRAG